MWYRLLFTLICIVSNAANLLADEPALVIDSGGNTRYVRKVIFTKNGKQLVSVGDERVIRVWDITSGRTERTIRDQFGPCTDCFISDIALSPDNAYLAVGGRLPGSTPEERYAINIYNFETGERIQQLAGHGARVSALAFSADGTQLASGSDYFKNNDPSGTDAAVRLWRLDSSQGWHFSLKLPGHNETVSSLAFSANGKQLASGSTDGSVFLWTLDVSPAPVGNQLRHGDAVFGLAFMKNGWLVSAGLDRRINVWDAQGTRIKQLGEQPSGIRSMDVSGDLERPRVLVGLQDGSARILSLSNGRLISRFPRGRDQVRAVAFSRTNKELVASTGGFNGEIWLWNTESGSIIPNGILAGVGRSIWSVGFGKDRASFAFGNQRGSNAPNKYGPLTQVVRLSSVAPTSAISPLRSVFQLFLGGNLQRGDYYQARIEVGEYSLKTRYGETVPRKGGSSEPVRLNELFILRNGKQVNSIVRDSTTGRSHLCFTFTEDGRYIISGGEGGYLALYDTQAPQKPIHEFRGHTNDVWSVAVSRDGRFIISGSSDQTIKLWEIKSDDYLLSIFVAEDREWIAWTPQGYYTSSFSGDKYIGWQVISEGKLRPEFYRAEQFQKLFYRPDVISRFLTTLDIRTAVDQAGPPRGDADTVRPTDVADNVPPRIEILDPIDKLTVNDRLLKVRIRVTSSNMPITNVQVLLNGFQMGTFRGIPEDTERSRKVEIEMMVALDDDTNTLVVNASHPFAKSQPQTRTISYKAPSGIPDLQLAESYLVKAKYYWPNEPASFAGERVSIAAKPPPPTIRIIEPEDSPSPIEITQQPLFMKVLVPADTQGREIKVRVLVNGVEKNIQDITPGLELPLNIALVEPREYTISVTSIVNEVESAPQTRKIKYVPNIPSRNLYFLGIGIKGYKDYKPGLDYADKDAEELAKLLKELDGSPLFTHVDTHVLSNDQATRENILKEIEWLNRQAVNPTDVRAVLFSGHGGLHGHPIPEYYFYVQDQPRNENPEIRSPNWSAIVRQLLNGSNNSGRGPVLLFVDTCRAGAASPKQLLDFEGGSGLVFFGASGAHENAIEKEEWGHGAFTKAVLEGLSGCADSSTVGRPADGMISFRELGSYIQLRVQELNDEQTAEVFPAKGLKSFNIALGPSRKRSEVRCPPPPKPQ